MKNNFSFFSFVSDDDKKILPGKLIHQTHVIFLTRRNGVASNICLHNNPASNDLPSF